MNPEVRPRILIIGCGGIGGLIAAHLLEDGRTVVHAVTRNVKHLEATAAHGLEVRGEGTPRKVAGRAYPEPPETTYDYALLAVQPPEVEQVAREVAPRLGQKGQIVVLQNGLCEERVARVLGSDEQVIGGIVSFGASNPEPGVYERTSPGGFVLGRMRPRGVTGGGGDPALARLADLVACVGPTRVTDNLAGARWSKLAINCAISSLGTLAGVRLGTLVGDRTARNFALEIFTEVVEVARALDVKLEKVSGTLNVDTIALDRNAASRRSLIVRHALIWAVGMKFRRMRSSMLAALERGRMPPVDFLNGEIVERGARVGVPTPANAAVQRAIHALARGEGKPSFEALHRTWREVRS